MDPPLEALPFRPLREIGRGAHGSVFLADGPAGRVALKVCRHPDDPARAADWEREKRGWSLFARIPPHPGLVRVFGTGETPDGAAFWVAMELADPEPGGSPDDPGSYRPLTLASVAAAEVALPLRRCVALGERLASALEHLQRHHLVHRDVKPGNVLFVRGRAVLADAGLVADDREAASLVGTPGYEPPEHHGTPQGDVFSLGRTLWRVATGRAPEEAGFAPCAEADTADPDFWRLLAILGRATSPVPERRHRSAKALRKDFARLRRRLRFRLARRIAVPALAAACAALLFALVWSLGRRSPPSPAASEPDPLDAVRDALRASGIRPEDIHVVVPGEVPAMVRGVNAAVEEAVQDIRADLDEVLEEESQVRKRGTVSGEDEEP